MTVQQTAPKAIGFVYGPPWVAECAAHLRTDCPAGFDATWVQHPNSATVLQDPSGTTYTNPLGTPQTDYANSFGAIVPVIQLDVPLPNTTLPQAAANVGSRFNWATYMVLLRDPQSPLGRGRVLGVISQDFLMLATPQFESFVIAPMQTELLQAMDLGRWVGAAAPRLGDPSAAETSGYCVDGVPPKRADGRRRNGLREFVEALS